MLLIIAPAKMLDESPVKPPHGISTPVFQQASDEVVARLRTYSAARLAELMAISPALARLNHARFRNWKEAPRKPAILLFNGHVYQTLAAPSLDRDDMRFAQRHLRILSGLYGLLRPLDMVAPHRLEMGTHLPMGKDATDLYAYWGSRIGRELHRTMRANRDTVLLNLASQEYAKAIRPEELPGRMITPLFKERTAKGLRTAAIHAKHQRGAMARWVIRHRLLDPGELKQYDADGYRFDPGESTEDQWTFIRQGPHAGTGPR
ncbi:MAG: peroxide stress protein YaaA [Flavobacteriales bacterium]|nr:peroxide stress protein YaaA [Flavobacteriales bacterium]MEB2340561.1 peroxide stress protein YaaA [Flavobacteriia bacterium]